MNAIVILHITRLPLRAGRGWSVFSNTYFGYPSLQGEYVVSKEDYITTPVIPPHR